MVWPRSKALLTPSFAEGNSIILDIGDQASSAAANLTGTVTADFIRNIHRRVTAARTNLLTIRSIPGLAAKARDEFDDQTFAAGTEFNAIIAAIDDILTAVDNLPDKDVANGTFASTETATLKTELEALATATGL